MVIVQNLILIDLSEIFEIYTVGVANGKRLEKNYINEDEVTNLFENLVNDYIRERKMVELKLRTCVKCL